MALSVAVCLFGDLAALGERTDDGHVRVHGVVSGTSIGLVLVLQGGPLRPLTARD